MKRVETFTVRGQGAFPEGLLECEQCRPATRQDLKMLSRRQLREITLWSENGAGPRPALWQQHGWSVICWKLAAPVRKGSPPSAARSKRDR